MPPTADTSTPHALASPLVHARMALPVADRWGLSGEELEHIPYGSPTMVAGNHQFALDPCVIGAFPVDCAAHDTQAVRRALRVQQG
ncbi:MAG: hypothetical protein AB1511_12950, partial [Deinococcota bacterium]